MNKNEVSFKKSLKVNLVLLLVALLFLCYQLYKKEESSYELGNMFNVVAITKEDLKEIGFTDEESVVIINIFNDKGNDNISKQNIKNILKDQVVIYGNVVTMCSIGDVYCDKIKKVILKEGYQANIKRLCELRNSEVELICKFNQKIIEKQRSFNNYERNKS